MFENYMEASFILIMIASLVAILFLIPLTLIQYYMHKKILDPTYYNSDHFSEGELVVFTSGLIFYVVKTLVYIRAIALPKTMRIRFKKDILTYNEHPLVYLLACFTMLLIILGGLTVFNTIIAFSLWSYYN